MVEWNEVEVNPGEAVQMKVKADGRALCALAAVDKSVQLLGNENKVATQMFTHIQYLNCLDMFLSKYTSSGHLMKLIMTIGIVNFSSEFLVKLPN